jgi:phosphate:Na+ symporter
MAIAAVFLFLTEPIARVAARLLPSRPDSENPSKPRHLDASALDTPSLAMSCAAREALRIGDVIEQMLTGMLTVLKTNDRTLAERLRKLDDVVDDLYTAVKLYLTQISREALEEHEGRRWADIVSFTINMEQIGDIIERIIIDVEDKKIDKGRNFSEAGMSEICDLHTRLIANLRLGLSVFLNGDLKSAHELLAQKSPFPRTGACLRRFASGTPCRQHAGQYRDIVTASRPHRRSPANQFAHLLDCVPDPRACGRAGQDPSQGASRDRAISGCPRRAQWRHRR